jgi:hypothetical protein
MTAGLIILLVVASVVGVFFLVLPRVLAHACPYRLCRLA